MEQRAQGLTLALDERSLHPATTVRAHLVAEVTAASPGIERTRPPLSVVLAVDTSGSMAGPPIEHVIQSIDRVVALLDATDRVGVVAFSNSASEVTSLLAADPKTRRLISTRCHRLVAEGGTNIEAGLQRAAAMMPTRGMHERQVVLLLSDGAPNVGRASSEELAAVARGMRPDVSVSTLGYGAQHHEDVLRAVSDAGAGLYHFIADPRVCELEFARAVGAQGDVVAEAVELALSPEPGVVIRRFIGRPDVRFGADGLRVSVPDLLEGHRHIVAAEVELTSPREPGPWTIARGVLSYRPAGEREVRAIAVEVSVVVSHVDASVDPAVRAQVLRARADEVRGEARALADRGQFDGAAAVLRRHIASIEAEPWFTRADGSPLAEALEQLVDEAVAMELRPSAEAYRSFRKSHVGTMLSVQVPADGASTHTKVALKSVAGKLPAARLVVLSGPLAGRRFELVQPRVVLGRTSAADIWLDDPKVSRQHLVVSGQNGRFLAQDMGSTNPAKHNGEVLTRPVVLAHGDLLIVGSVELRYEEGR
jgi:Ca-activated chloride channel family protein